MANMDVEKLNITKSYYESYLEQMDPFSFQSNVTSLQWSFILSKQSRHVTSSASVVVVRLTVWFISV